MAILEKTSGTNRSKFCSAEVKILNLKTLQWEDLNVKPENVTLPGRKHAATSI